MNSFRQSPKCVNADRTLEKNRWQTNEKHNAPRTDALKRTKEALFIVLKLLFTKLGPSPSRKLYEMSVSQIAYKGNVMCQFQIILICQL